MHHWNVEIGADCTGLAAVTRLGLEATVSEVTDGVLEESRVLPLPGFGLGLDPGPGLGRALSCLTVF